MHFVLRAFIFSCPPDANVSHDSQRAAETSERSEDPTDNLSPISAPAGEALHSNVPCEEKHPFPLPSVGHDFCAEVKLQEESDFILLRVRHESFELSLPRVRSHPVSR